MHWAHKHTHTHTLAHPIGIPEEMKNKQTKSVTPNNLWLILNELNVKACWIFYQNIKYRLALGNMNQGKTAPDDHCIAFACCLYTFSMQLFLVRSSCIMQYF